MKAVVTPLNDQLKESAGIKPGASDDKGRFIFGYVGQATVARSFTAVCKCNFFAFFEINVTFNKYCFCISKAVDAPYLAANVFIGFDRMRFGWHVPALSKPISD